MWGSAWSSRNDPPPAAVVHLADRVGAPDLEVPLAVIYAHSERQDLNAQAERAAGAVATLVEDNLENALPVSSPLVITAARRYGPSDRRSRDRAGQGRRRPDRHRPAELHRPVIPRPARGSGSAGRAHRQRQYAVKCEWRRAASFVAVPVASGGEVNGAVILTYSTASVEGRIHRYWLTLAGIAIIALAAAALVGWRFARRVTRPLRNVERAAGTAGAGDLAVRAPVGGPPEVRSLARELQRHDRQAREPHACPGGVRRRRLPPTAHAACDAPADA